jgi:hypothetical protein
MSGGKSFRLVPKMMGNMMEIYIVAGAEHMKIAQILFPNDKQTFDNMRAGEEVIKILTKRIRQSV